MIEIEKSSGPIPARKTRKYPFLDMEVGDSFLIECSEEDMLKTRQRLVGSVNSIIKYRGLERKFATRKEEKGIRIYRSK